MKKFLKYAMYISLLMVAFSFTACQKENVFQPGTDEQQTLAANSATAVLVERTVSNDGSFDNIVDGSSCFDIRFPYHVRVNGTELTMGSRDDLHVIEELFDAVDDDENILDIIFPVTITLADYSEITINSIDEIRALAAQCKEGGDDDDIECIDIVYPVTLFTFDTSLTSTGSFVVESDMEMRRFFAGLGENDLMSIDFPVTLHLYDGSEMAVNSNTELAAAIESAKLACDEDDDNDYNDDDFTKEQLDNLLSECPWLVKNMVRNNMMHTEQYFDYLMAFSPDGTVTVRAGLGNSVTGTWSTVATDKGIMIKLAFDVLVDFNLEWYVYEIEEGKIKLHSGEGNWIIMKNACDLVNTPPDTLRNILKECNWVIKKVYNQGVEIDRLLGYEFTFLADGTVTLSNGITTSNGTWEITTNAEGRLVMAISMGDEPGVNFEWPLSDLRNDRLKFDVAEIGYELILQRVCGDNMNDGDVVEIRSIMMNGEWSVTQYSDSGADETQNYMGYTFGFQAENILGITATPTGPTLAGLWRVIRNSDGILKVYLNAGDTEPLVELTDDWDFVRIIKDELTNEVIGLELRNVSEIAGSAEASVKVLVFEKNM
ncbi:MAG: hypothetical protein MUO53_11010 [Maribacter sp.]|nr:hypothetical protein [Maribacter sp.]